VKGKELSPDKKKALALDIRTTKQTNKQLAEKFNISTKTVSRARSKLSKQVPNSVLTMKRALELAQVQSMMTYYLEVLERITGQIETDQDMKLDKKSAAIRENLIVTLNIHNSLAFTDIPAGEMDYTDTEVTLFEIILDMIPEDRREEFNAKISEFTKTKDERTDDTVQPDGRPEAGAIPEEPGTVCT
jgi:hypothetical protein